MLFRAAIALAAAIILVTPAMFSKPRRYNATMTVAFPTAGGDAPMMPGTFMAMMNSTPTGGNLPVMTYLSVITSQRCLVAAAQSCGVPEAFRLRDFEAIARWMRGAVSATLRQDRLLQISTNVPGTPLVTKLADFTNRKQAAERDKTSKELSARLCFALLKSMEAIADEIEIDRSKADLKRLRERYDNQNARLIELGREFVRICTDTSIPDPGSYVGGVSQRMSGVLDKLNDSNLEVTQLRKQLEGQQRVLRDQLNALPELPMEVPLLASSREAYNKALSAYNEQTAKYGAESPEVLAAELTLRLAREDLERRANQARKGQLPDIAQTMVQLRTAEAKRSQLVTLEQQYAHQATSAPRTVQPLLSLKQQLEEQQSVVSSLRSQVLKAEMNYDQSGVRWFILDRPLVPRYHSNLGIRSVVLGAFLLALTIFFSPALGALASRMLRLNHGG